MLEKSKNLASLDLGDTKITDEGLKAIARGCPKLERLSVRFPRCSAKDKECLDRIKAEIEQEDGGNSFSFT